MFAVPGWSLGELKSQPEGLRSKNNTSKKRKRKLAEEKARVKNATGSNSTAVGERVGSSDGQLKQKDGQTHPIEASSVSASNTLPKVHNSSKNRDAQDQHSRNENKKRKFGDVEAAAGPPKNTQSTSTIDALVGAIPAAPPISSKLTPLQSAMRKKLTGARFRYLNETLYTSPSAKALALFNSNPSFFDEYHSGFRQQVSNWPENPMDSLIDDVKRRLKIRSSDKGQGPPALPRTSGTCTVVDLGCGDAALARKLAGETKKFSLRVLSYDLHSNNPSVIKADIANLPLDDGSANVAIFCLALMGTNWLDFIDEAWRVLHWKGELWVAEIKSRFAAPRKRQVEHSVGKRRKNPKRRPEDNANQEDTSMAQIDGGDSREDITDVSAFVQALGRRGFSLQSEGGTDTRNKMFVKMRFIKHLTPNVGKHTGQSPSSGPNTQARRPMFAPDDGDGMDDASVLKPCLYKIR